MPAQVVLRDFDGAETLYPKSPPLPEVIHTGDTDTGLLILRHYVRTQETDQDGRIVYVQSNL